jgi:hypothetical protein
MGERKVAEFLTHLMVPRHISPVTQNQMLTAMFLARFGDNPSGTLKVFTIPMFEVLVYTGYYLYFRISQFK